MSGAYEAQIDTAAARTTIGVGSDHCRACGLPVFWSANGQGNMVPLDTQQRLDGDVQVLANGTCRIVEPGRGSYVAHFRTCAKADSFRRRGSK